MPDEPAKLLGILREVRQKSPAPVAGNVVREWHANRMEGRTVHHRNDFREVVWLCGIASRKEREGSSWMTCEDLHGELIDCDLRAFVADFRCHTTARSCVLSFFIKSSSRIAKLEVGSSQSEEER